MNYIAESDISFKPSYKVTAKMTTIVPITAVNAQEAPISKFKKTAVGSRADVYEGRADHTSGGLKRTDIVRKIIAGKVMYISQRAASTASSATKLKSKYSSAAMKSRKSIMKIIPTLPLVSCTMKNVKFNLENNTVRTFDCNEFTPDDYAALSSELATIKDNNATAPAHDTTFIINELDDIQLTNDVALLF
jgi:hypothetical protein